MEWEETFSGYYVLFNAKGEKIAAINTARTSHIAMAKIPMEHQKLFGFLTFGPRFLTKISQDRALKKAKQWCEKKVVKS